MNKQELIENLNSLGINPRNYTLDGYYKDSTWVLEKLSVKEVHAWSVFNFERGKRYDEIKFYSESEACIYIYEKLKAQKELIKKYNLKG